jgi:hypothetical protein
MTNTLIESPTGSGKTLSLICSSLAWQRAEYGEFRNYNFSLFAYFKHFAYFAYYSAVKIKAVCFSETWLILTIIHGVIFKKIEFLSFSLCHLFAWHVIEHIRSIRGNSL